MNSACQLSSDGPRGGAPQQYLLTFLPERGYTEARSGRGKTDILLPKPKRIIEAKVWTTKLAFEDGIVELGRYIHTEEAEGAYMVVFGDRVPLPGIVADLSGVHFKLKDFRATFWQTYIDSGTRTDKVSLAMRHSSTNVTERFYGRIKSEDAFRDFDDEPLIRVERLATKSQQPTHESGSGRTHIHGGTEYRFPRDGLGSCPSCRGRRIPALSLSRDSKPRKPPY